MKTKADVTLSLASPEPVEGSKGDKIKFLRYN
jgi:hypothetical protein